MSLHAAVLRDVLLVTTEKGTSDYRSRLEYSYIIGDSAVYSPVHKLMCPPVCLSIIVPTSDPTLIIYVVWLCVNYLHFKAPSPAPI